MFHIIFIFMFSIIVATTLNTYKFCSTFILSPWNTKWATPNFVELYMWFVFKFKKQTNKECNVENRSIKMLLFARKQWVAHIYKCVALAYFMKLVSSPTFLLARRMLWLLLPFLLLFCILMPWQCGICGHGL